MAIPCELLSEVCEVECWSIVGLEAPSAFHMAHKIKVIMTIFPAAVLGTCSGLP